MSPNSNQFVRVEFARAICSIKPGVPRHPWHWCVTVQNGHMLAISTGHSTLESAVRDFLGIGVEQVLRAENELADMYAENGERYDVAMVNPITDWKAQP